MSKPTLIAVPSASGKVSGAIVYWRLSGGLDLPRLREAWEARALDAKLLPEAPSPTTALRRAVGILKKPTTRIESTRAGLVVLDREEQGTAGDIDFKKRLVATIDIVGRVRFPFALWESDKQAVEWAFRDACDNLAGADVSPWLASLMRALDAVPLRDTGGVYFVPAFSLPRFESMLEALREATAHVVAAIPALDSKEAVQAVLDALESEAEGELSAMRKEVGATTLGARALNTRIDRAASVETKLSSYENLLGGRLDGLRERITTMRAELTVAMTVAEAKEVAS